MTRRWFLAAGVWAVAVCSLPALAAPAPAAGGLLEQCERAAFRYFVERSDTRTGLVTDRAANSGKDTYDVASIAATGYGLAALPIGVERKWITRSDATNRAMRTLSFVLKMDHQHGWLYHFVDQHSGKRVWNSEVSTIDTSLLVQGALVAGAYLGGDVRRLADRLYERLDWRWVRTNGGLRPTKLTVSHGWKPESGFIPNEWDSYCELMVIYLLGMGARRNPLPPASWDAWARPVYADAGLECLAGGPLFFHQMGHGFYDFRGTRDRLGYDYAVSAANGTELHRGFCRANRPGRRSYAEGWWGLSATDIRGGYAAAGLPGPEDGTVAPLALLACVGEQPAEVVATLTRLKARYGDRAWGRYGFCDAFNVDQGWFDPDTIGIDVGMALVAIENHRTGLVRRLVMGLLSTRRAIAAAGLRPTRETGKRPLRRP